jgi:hypothetical protein
MIEPRRYSKLTPDERRRLREAYIKDQKDLCWYCHSSLYHPPPIKILSKPIKWFLFPEGFMNHPIHLQHDHMTDRTEGAVHAYCNAVLWQYEHR